MTFEAIGVTNVVAVDRAAALGPALELAEREVRALDEACSRFRDDSELAAVNRAAGAEVAAASRSRRATHSRLTGSLRRFPGRRGTVST